MRRKTPSTNPLQNIFDSKERKYRKSLIELKEASVNFRPPRRLQGEKK